MSEQLIKRGNRELDLTRIELAFVSDTERRPVDFFYTQICEKNPESSDLSLKDVLTHASKERWSEKRKSYWDGVKAAWLKQKQLEVLHRRTVELREADTLRASVFKAVNPDVDLDGNVVLPIKPQSYEGMIRAFVQLDGLVDNKRNDILHTLEPMLQDVQPQTKDGGQEIPFSPTEMRSLAHGLLKERRRLRQQELGIIDAEAVPVADNNLIESDQEIVADDQKEDDDERMAGGAGSE